MDGQPNQPTSGNTPASPNLAPTGTNPAPQHVPQQLNTQNQGQNIHQQGHQQQHQGNQRQQAQQQSKPAANQAVPAGEPQGIGKLGSMFDSFIKQSERVLNVTHKPGRDEFKQIAMSTAIGMVVVGIIGYIIAMAAVFLRSAISGA